MITGHNTDVRYGDVVLHVQTEDKGLANPFIESLIYYGGQVVVAKRGSYADLVEQGKGEEEIMVLMDHQHRTMIKAIQAGKFDEKIRVFLPDKSKLPKRDTAPSSASTVSEQVVTFDMSSDTGRTLDQVILDYLTSEAEQEQLVLVMEEDAEIRAGANTDLALRTRSSRSGHPVSAATVNVRMISTFGGPRTLGLGKTDDEGFLHLRIEIPQVDRGSAALIITANCAIGQAEIKHLL